MTPPLPSPAVQFGPLGGNTRGVDPVDGVSSFHTVVDISEPVSIGAPPVTPTLVRRASVRPVIAHRTARARSGHLCVHPMSTALRAMFTVEWGALNGADEQLLWGWIDEDLLGQRSAFTLDVDGDESVLVPVRLTEECREQLSGTGKAGGAGRIGGFVGVECEEVLEGE